MADDRMTHPSLDKHDVPQRDVSEDELGPKDARTIALEVIEMSPIGILAANSAGKVLIVSLKLKETLGLDSDTDYTGSSLFEMPFSKDRTWDSIIRMALSGQSGELVFQEYSLGDKTVYLNVKCAPLLRFGEVAGLLLMVEDVSKLMAADAALRTHARELEVANKELEAFSYSVSHDLRAPLRAIAGFSSLLEKNCSKALDEQGKSYLSLVRDGATRMDDIINDLLRLSQISRTQIAKEEVDLSGMVKAAAATLQSADPDRKVELVIAENAKAVCDSRLVRVLIENLMNNAWKFTSKKPQARIEFGVIKKEGKRIFYVKDNGAGFEMAYVDRLFKPFVRLHSTEEFPGTGIGLATVQRVIARHGGRAWAEGEREQGATFYFTL